MDRLVHLPVGAKGTQSVGSLQTSGDRRCVGDLIPGGSVAGMALINVALSNLEGLLREIVTHALASDDQINVTAEYADVAQLKPSVRLSNQSMARTQNLSSKPPKGRSTARSTDGGSGADADASTSLEREILEPDVVIAVDDTRGAGTNTDGEVVPDHSHQARSLGMPSSLTSPSRVRLVDHGRAAYLEWLEPRSLALGELSPDALVRAVREIAARQTSIHSAGNLVDQDENSRNKH